jgi:hypothetical protein
MDLLTRLNCIANRPISFSSSALICCCAAATRLGERDTGMRLDSPSEGFVGVVSVYRAFKRDKGCGEDGERSDKLGSYERDDSPAFRGRSSAARRLWIALTTAKGLPGNPEDDEEPFA